MRLLLRQGLRHHKSQPMQTLLTLLGIAAGVALLCAMRLSQTTAERAFDRAVEAVAGTATHTITGGPDGLPVAAYAKLAKTFGGDRVAPAVQAIARVPDRAERTVLRVLGIDPFGGAAMRPWSGPRSKGLPVGRLVTQPNTFVATQELLNELDLQLGGTLSITVGGRAFQAICIGELTPPANVAAGLADTLVVDIATAQEWTARPNRIDRIDLTLALDSEEMDARIRAACGSGARIERAGRSRTGLSQLTRGFRINVTALSLLSLLVGAFLVHETMRLSVVARRSTFGVLRALGVQGRSLGVLVALEALVLGAIGSAIGVGLGVLAAHALLEPIVRTLNDHYATFALPTLDIDIGELLLAAGGGVAVTMLAALAPAFAASRVSPRDVLVTAHATAPRSHRTWRWHVLWSLPPAGISVLLLTTVGTRLVQGYFGMLFMLIAAVLLTPVLLTAALRLLSLPLLRLGPFSRYVVRSTIAAKEHLALPVAAMVLAVATTIGMAVLVTSFRNSVQSWLGQVLPADIYASVPGGVDERSQTIDPRIVAALTADQQIAEATLYHRTLMPLAGGDASRDVEVVGMQASDAWLSAWPLLDADRSEARAALDAGDVWISEPLAFRRDLGKGDSITLGVEDAAVTLRIAAVYRDYSSERGEVLLQNETLRGHGFDVGVTALGLELDHSKSQPIGSAAKANAAAAAAANAACRRLAALAADQTDDGRPAQGVLLRSTLELRQTSLEIFDRTFAITGVMRLLCLAVAFFGIYSAFAALQFERAAEVGLLRCLGARPSRIGVVVIGQTALLGAAAALLSLPLGLLIGQLLAHVINRVSFGWSLVEITVPGHALVEATLLAVGAAVLAGIWPAIRFARMRPADALRES
ncbi:MAG: FtsX-like permease family protein [Planctomycetota bacterium]